MKYTDSPLNNLCSGVKEILNEYISREANYIYAPYNKRKMFTLKDKEDYLHNSNLSIDEYIHKYNLEYKWTRINIQDNFTYKQLKRFKKSGLSLDEYIEKYNLYSSTLSESEQEDNINSLNLFGIRENDEYDYADYYDDDIDSWGE
jgi:hypothetical protein